MSDTSNIIVYDFGFRGNLSRESVTKANNDDTYPTQIVCVLRLCTSNGDVITQDFTGNIRFSLIDYHDKSPLTNDANNVSNWVINSSPVVTFNDNDYSYSCTWGIIARSNVAKPITIGYEIELSNNNYSGKAQNTSSDGAQNPITLAYAAQ
ncbi:hypothetical protein [Ochrobactrum sp. MYb379]|uniref:hypothetical protein n=1 Tax=Ochrobactrum sp. MYb379 TaxID=2745275 RepID=UPI0030AF5878